MADRVEDVVVWGNRRPANTGGGYGGVSNGGGKGNSGGVRPREVPMDPDEPPPYQYDPCDSPEKRFERAADAAAAALFKKLKAFAKSLHPTEDGINAREYGAVLWQLPNGNIVPGPLSAGEFRFDQAYLATNGRSGVAINWTAPATGAVLVGMMHTHGVGDGLISGGNYNQDDQANLTYVQSFRQYQQVPANLARLYVGFNEPGSYETPGPTKISVYNQYNRDAAISGQRGPEVDPEGKACPAT